MVETIQDEEKMGQKMVQYTQLKEDRKMHYISVRTYSTHLRFTGHYIRSFELFTIANVYNIAVIVI